MTKFTRFCKGGKTCDSFLHRIDHEVDFRNSVSFALAEILSKSLVVVFYAESTRTVISGAK